MKDYTKIIIQTFSGVFNTGNIKNETESFIYNDNIERRRITSDITNTWCKISVEEDCIKELNIVSGDWDKDADIMYFYMNKYLHNHKDFISLNKQIKLQSKEIFYYLQSLNDVKYI
ncbi:hypothetical protein [Arcobacter arenosus]|uniref:Uncharacterized protein n=1 Tax=Arcobacter arenosus TaxID=2576037 RepID=A0A5R8XXZ2_9BACT|nr:hypothetical protein [Arcobacter arenosus]TLP36210.1 hypothetical protein FDK22_13145 [Arcobacter arenosus]